MENLKCPCCGSGPFRFELMPKVTFDTKGCPLEHVRINAVLFDDPALRIAEREAEKRGVQKCVDEASRRELKDLTETLKRLLK